MAALYFAIGKQYSQGTWQKQYPPVFAKAEFGGRAL
jgi:hypothetical protein